MSNYDTLVISGGSTSGITIVGRLCRLLHEKKIDLNSVKNFSGVSIGALICYFIILGYKPVDIFSIIINNDIPGFFTKNFSPLSGFIGGGFYSLKKFKQKIFDTVGVEKSKLCYRDLVCKNFLCTAYNLDKKNYEIFSPQTTPDMNILDSVIMSCSIPLVFEPTIYKGNRYVDGGIINNFPLKETRENFNCTKILGIICVKNYNNYTPPNIWRFSDILTLLFAHTVHRIDEQLSETTQDIDIVNVRSSLPFYSLQLTLEQVFHMFLEGLIGD